MTNSEVLDQVDTKLDELDVLLSKFTAINTREYRQRLYDLYADLESAVENSCC